MRSDIPHDLIRGYARYRHRTMPRAARSRVDIEDLEQDGYVAWLETGSRGAVYGRMVDSVRAVVPYYRPSRSLTAEGRRQREDMRDSYHEHRLDEYDDCSDHPRALPDPLVCHDTPETIAVTQGVRRWMHQATYRVPWQAGEALRLVLGDQSRVALAKQWGVHPSRVSQVMRGAIQQMADMAGEIA